MHKMPVSSRRRAAWLTVPPVAALLIVALAACTPADRFSAGESLDRDELASISEAIFTGTDEAPPASETDTSDITETEWVPETVRDVIFNNYPDGTVFWSKGNPAYHADLHCRHLLDKESSEIYRGTVDEAHRDGKRRACSCNEAEDESETNGGTM